MKARPLLLALLLALTAVAIVKTDHHDDHEQHVDDDDHHDDDDDHHDDDHDHHDDHDHDHDDHRDHGEDFDKIDHRLDKLTSRIEHLRDAVHRRTNPSTIRKARSIQARVQKLEGSGCNDRHFQCGGSDPECQSYLFVCDGHKDCRNGADEAFCELPTKKGDYFEGHMIWDTCTQRKPDVLGFEITDVKSYDYFTPVVELRANIVVEYENDLFDGHASLPTVGTYHFGRNIVAITPPEDDRLGLFCVFDGFNHDRCDGFIAHEGSMDICAEFIFVRQHDDHDHHDDRHH